MSFGVSVGDFVLLYQITHRTFRNCQKAGEEYIEIAFEVRCLYSVLRTLREVAQTPESMIFKEHPSSTKQLLATADGCMKVLDSLNSMLGKYEGLNVDGQTNVGKKLWQSFRFGSKAEELGVIREQIIMYTSTISMLMNTMQIQTAGRLESKIDTGFADINVHLAEVRRAMFTIASEHRADKKASAAESMLSLSTAAGDEKVVWRSFRRGLLQRGYTSRSLAKHENMLITYMLELDQSGVLDTDRSAKEPSVASDRGQEARRSLDSDQRRSQADDGLAAEGLDSENVCISHVFAVLDDGYPDPRLRPPLPPRKMNGKSLHNVVREDLRNAVATSSDARVNSRRKRRTSPREVRPSPIIYAKTGTSRPLNGMGAVNTPQIGQTATEGSLDITSLKVRFTLLHRLLVSPELLESCQEAYTKVGDVLCVHRVLSRWDIERHITMEASRRGLYVKAKLRSNYPSDARKQTYPFPLGTALLRSAVNARALQSGGKDYSAIGDVLHIHESIENDEIKSLMEITQSLRGDETPTVPIYPVHDSMGRTTTVGRFYIFDSRVIVSDSRLDDILIEDVLLDPRTGTSSSMGSRFITYAASLGP
ncbi:hypothetical protein VTL71DRAFT_4322 [Oculimacula yallundae]|uniref:Fungal N-terminal domain-containing protein n=1 Tax=Oculimacula yallundae TaxID=86028 RepID=A0ABR4C6N0_9HELO